MREGEKRREEGGKKEGEKGGCKYSEILKSTDRNNSQKERKWKVTQKYCFAK